MNYLDIIAPVLSYCIGCITAGYYLVRWQKGFDVRTHGSGATGATNVGRVSGWKGFVATTIFDVLKGTVVILIAQELQVSEISRDASFLAVIAGHIWPAQLQFRGGKGVNPTIGALFLLNPPIFSASIILYFLSFLFSRDYVINGIVVFAMTPFVALVLGLPLHTIITMSIMALMSLYAQRDHVKKYVIQQKK